LSEKFLWICSKLSVNLRNFSQAPEIESPKLEIEGVPFGYMEFSCAIRGNRAHARVRHRRGRSAGSGSSWFFLNWASRVQTPKYASALPGAL